MRKNHFDTPAQVRYWDDGAYASGIAFGGVVICACCGGVSSLEEICDQAEEDGVQAIYEYTTWENLSESLGCGDIDGEIAAGFFKE